MCLFNGQNPERELGRGTHLGFTWVVRRASSGHRCGYVRVPDGHPWHGRYYGDIHGVSVHGGLTFSEREHGACALLGDCDGWGHWLGFHCGHGFDAPDPELLSVYFAPIAASRLTTGTVRTQEYVEAECKKLCEQAHAALPSRVLSEVSEGAEATRVYRLPPPALCRRRLDFDPASYSRRSKGADVKNRSSTPVECRRRLDL